jgi:hypothetical protein
VLKLAQDDDSEIRSIINSIIADGSATAACDRKSLERLVDFYFKNIVKPFPLHGLTLIIGLLLRDDFEIKAEEADDVRFQF